MKIVWSSRAWDDYLYWQQADRDTLIRINALIKDTFRSPFAGIGKPEPLRGHLRGWWSRRITASHRLVYRVSGKDDAQCLEIATCRQHYQ